MTGNVPAPVTAMDIQQNRYNSIDPSFNEKLIMANEKSGMDVSTTFLTPYLSAKNPATGLIISAPIIRIGKPLMICSTDQPNSSINGATNTPIV